MSTVSITTERTRFDGATSLRGVRLLTGGYVGLSAATLVAIFLLRHDAAAVNGAVWVRGTLVLLSAALTTLFAARAARGSTRALLRLRIVSVVMVAAIAVVVALPGTFPLWMRIEQGVCGLLLLGVIALVFRPRPAGR